MAATGPQTAASLSPAMSAFFSTPGATTTAQSNPVAGTQSTNGFTGGTGLTTPAPTIGSSNATSPIQTTVPVVTSAAATADFNNKQQAFQNLQAQVANQQSVKAQQAAQKAADDAKAQADAAQLKIQQQEADTNAQTAATKAAAVAAANAPTTDTTNVTNTDGTGTTTTNTTTPQVTTPNQGAPVDTTQQGLNDATNQLIAGQNDIQNQKDALTQQMNNQLTGLLQGTVPLSAPQVALVTSLQNQLTQNVQQQQLANDAQLGAAREAAFRAGGQYSPEEAANTLANTISQGTQRIQELDNSAASTIAKMENDFQTQDFNIINKNFDVLSKQLDDKSTALQNMYNAVTSQIKDQRDFQEKVNEFQQGQQMEQQKQDLAVKQFDLSTQQFGLSKANSAVDNKLKLAQVAKIYSDMSTTDTSAAADWVKNIQSGVAKLTDVPAGLKNAVASGLANGNPQGVNGLLSTTANSLNELVGMVNSNQGFTGAVGAKGLSSLFGLTGPIPGTSAADFDAKLKQVTNDVVLPNLTILHGLGRVTDREFQSLQAAITSLSPNLSEDAFKKELTNVVNVVTQKMQENQSSPSYQAGTSLNSIFNLSAIPTSPQNGKVQSAFSSIGL